MSHADRTRRGTRAASADDDFDDRLDRPGEDDLFDGGDDLRYEGPISFDDVEDEPRGADPGGGRVIVTALLIGAAVILLVGVALWLRRDVPPEAVRVSQADEAAATVPPAKGTTTSLEDKIAAAPSLPASEPVTAGPDAADDGPAPPSPDDGSDDAGAPAAPRLAESPPVVAPAPAPAEAALLHDAAPQRPSGAAAAPVREDPAPAAAVASRPSPAPARQASAAPPAGASGSMRDLVRAGQLDAAAKAGSWKARSAHDPYALQLGHLCSPANIKSHFAAVADPRLLIVPGAKAGCYRLLWGTYGDAAAARGATGSVPSRFKDAPRPVALGSILPR